MDSNLWLRIKDQSLSNQYLLSRNRFIARISTFIFAYRIFQIIIVLIQDVIYNTNIIDDIFIVRSIICTFHLALILLGLKFPIPVSQLHAPFMSLSYLPYLIHLTCSKQQPNIAVQGVINYFISLLLALITNNQWMLTVPAIILTLIGNSTFNTSFIKFYDLNTMTLLVISTLFFIWFTHSQERDRKQIFLQIHYIQKINNDFQNLLKILPESIALYNEKQDEVIFANQDFKRMFHCFTYHEILFAMKAKMFQSKKQFKPDEAFVHQDTNNNEKISLLEAIQQNGEGQCFQKYEESSDDQGSSQDKIIVQFKKSNILFQDQETQVIIVYDLSSVVKFEKLKLENHFYEMLTATVSHDMRTPLNAIIGLLSSLESFVTEERGKRFLDIISHSSKILLYLVNDLLDFYQIKNGKFRKNEQPVNIVSSVQTLLEIFRICAQEKGLALNFVCISVIPEELSVDEQRVKQVLINLINNAFKFTFKGSIIVYASYDGELNKLKFTVRDTGIGIKQQDRNKLFALFGKLESTFSINTSGIGLGLNICQTIVQAFDGEIFLEEQFSVEQGSAFTFTMKCKDNQQTHIELDQQALELSHTQIMKNEESMLLTHQELEIIVESNEQNLYTTECVNKDTNRFHHFCDQSITRATKQMTEREDCPCLSRRKLLIADDNIFNIVTLETIIEFKFKLMVDRTQTGKGAVEKVQSRIEENLRNPCFCGENNQNYLIILMDCNMPVMDGFQATGEIKRLALSHNLDIKIVALTAYTTDNFKAKCFSSGMDAFLTKPIAVPLLQDILQSYNIIK